MISLKKLETKKELTDFVKFPFSLYKDSKTWIPPLVKDEVNSFDKDINPVFETSDADFFLAYRDGVAVGRIAVIVNHHEIEKQGVRKVRFGWLDMIDDIEVTKALIGKAIEKCRELSLDYIEGPMGFSNMDKVGVQISGFEHIGNMITWTNHPYYFKHLEALGMTKEKGFIETSFKMDDVNYQTYKKAGDLIQRRYGLSFVPFKSNKDIIPYVDKMFDLFNTTYANLSSFVPVSEKQKQFFKDKYIPLVDHRFIKFIEDKNKKLVCFAIVLPSFSKALQRSKGSLFPFGFLHFLWAKARPKVMEFYLIGIAPEYQVKGVPAILFREYYEIFSALGVEKCILTPELEDNYAVQNLWKNFKPVVFAKRNTYRLNIENSDLL